MAAHLVSADDITGLRGLEAHLKPQTGQRLIIFGASGGVGHIALQLARRMGAKVLAISSGKDGAELARRLGTRCGTNTFCGNDTWCCLPLQRLEVFEMVLKQLDYAGSKFCK